MEWGKIIKIFKRLIWMSMLFTSIALVSTFGAIHLPVVQNYTLTRVISAFEDRLPSKLSFTSARLRPLNTIHFKDLYVEDLEQDTLLFAPNCKVTVKGILAKAFSQEEVDISLKKITLKNAYIRLYNDSTFTVNIKPLIQQMKKPDSLKNEPKPFYINEIELSNCKMAIYRFDSIRKETVMDPTRIVLNELNINIKHFAAHADTINLDIKHMSLKESAGFVLDDFKSDLTLYKSALHFQSVDILTPYSRLNFERVHFDFNDFSDFKSVFDKVEHTYEITQSEINLLDVGCFVPIFNGVEQVFKMNGTVFGTLDNFKAKKLNVTLGESTKILADFDINGMPNFKETFLMVDFKEVSSSAADLNSLNLPRNKKLSLPDNLSGISKFRYAGNFTGFFRDFVSFGELQTDIGNIKTDLTIVPDSARGVILEGTLSTENFLIGEVLETTEKLGEVTFNANISGVSRVDSGFDVNFNGNFKKLEFNGYPYANIKANGDLKNKLFDGFVTINDPAAELEFEGVIDYSSEIAGFNFLANVTHADLHKLNFTKGDSVYTASFFLEATGTGNSLNEINTDIKLINSFFTRSNRQIQLYNLQLNVRNDTAHNSVLLLSDVLDVRVEGAYKLNEIPRYFTTLVHKVYPSLQLCTDSSACLNDSLQNLNFQVNFKRVQPILNFFTEGKKIADKTILEGAYSYDSISRFGLHFKSPGIGIGNSFVKSMNLNARIEDDKLQTEFGASRLSISDRVNLDNFTLISSTINDSLHYISRWLNWDTNVYRGNFEGTILLEKELRLKPKIIARIDSSRIVVSDTTWEISPFVVKKNKSSWDIDNFRMQHASQKIAVNGGLSQEKGDSMYVRFENFDLANVNFINKNKDLGLSGVLNGDASLSGKLGEPIFIADLVAGDMYVNSQQIGDCKIFTGWNNSSNSLFIDGQIYRDKQKTLTLNGDYYPAQDGALNLSCELQELNLQIVAPYIAKTFNNLEGYVTGKANIGGTIKKPLVNGTIGFNNTSFKMDYLGTKYHFSSDFSLINNQILFDRVLVYDENDNQAELYGNVNLNEFKNIVLALNMQASDFLCLNTGFSDNRGYYGTVLADGIIKLEGPIRNMNISANATTKKGTEFYIPIDAGGNAIEYDFVSFFLGDSNEVVEKEIELTSEEQKTIIDLDLNVNVTSDAEVQIIFDQALGDIIKANGEGDIQVRISEESGLKIYGEYIINRGDYLFTLQDVINKRFKIEGGSALQWSGSPSDVMVDIGASYRTRASLFELMQDTSNTSRTTVDCQLLLNGSLKEPEITYGINLPTAEPEVRDMVQSRITTQEQLSRQFLSLLVLNRFYYDQTTGGSGQESTSGSIAGVSASELLSNQLSNWLSQLSNDVDIGVNYRPGSDVTPTEVELALSTQLLNDRLYINGSVDMATNAEAQNANQVVGDIDIDYKLNQSGKMRLRAFNRANDADIRQNSPYTQGFGIYYVEEFDSLGELWKQYMAFFNGERKKKKKK